jgi:hypothetical protein
MRDNQKSKVYRAEGAFRRECKIKEETIVDRLNPDLSEVRALYEMLAEEFGTHVPPVETNGRLERYAGITYYGEKIVLRPGCSAYTALHEFAHWMPNGATHGWGFVQNMITLIDYWYGVNAAGRFKNICRRSGIIWHKDDHDARRQKARAADSRRYERNGEQGTVYVLRYVNQTGQEHYACLKDGWHAYGLHRAGAWRRLATAEKKAKLRSRGRVQYEILKAEGVFDAYENRWHAKSLVDKVERPLVSA